MASAFKPTPALLRLSRSTVGFDRGAAWYGTRQRIVGGFETQFRFRISNPTTTGISAPGGDGFAFVIQNEAQTVIGTAGADIGYATIRNSLAVEFDTYTNGGDIGSNHVAVQASSGPNSSNHTSAANRAGPVAIGANAAIGALEDGQVHTALIRYSPSQNHRLDIYVDDTLRINTTLNIDATVNLFDGYGWVGFTASTGGSQADFDILSWQFRNFSSDSLEETVGVYRYSTSPTGGTFYLRNSNSTGTADTTITLSYATSADLPVVGDWNGDGLDTPGLFNPTSGLWRLSNASSSGTYSAADVEFFFTSPLAGYDRLPVAGDWNGDGRDTIGVYFRPQPATQTLGLFYLRNSNTTGDFDAYTYLGFAGDIPVSGDWNGDGIDNAGVYTPSGTYGGLWTLVNQNIPSPAYTYVWYGVPPGTRPVVGDWNGSGDTTVGLQQPNPTTGVSAFLLKNSNESGPAPTTDPAFFYGIPTDQPLAGNWAAACPSGVVASSAILPPAAGCFVQPLPTPTFVPTPGISNCGITTQGSGDGGLALRESPTKNSPRLSSIPWNTPLTGIYRLDVDSEIWYQVNYQGVSGWIAAIIGGVQYASNANCPIPTPYPPDWSTLAQITMAEFTANGGCTMASIEAYLNSESTELLLARTAYAEAAVFSTEGGGDNIGGILFEDARLITWTIRMSAFIGLPNYSAGSAGDSVSISDQILDPGEYEPITILYQELTSPSTNCNPANIASPNVRRMVFPVNSSAASVVELFQLWRVYQTVISDGIVTSAWTSYPSSPFNLKGFHAFIGVAINLPCPQTKSTAQGLSRPGPGLTWAANQPYPPRVEVPYLHPVYSALQANKTCYQDRHHLDDLFWAALTTTTPDLGAPLPTGFALNTFPKQFAVVVLKDPTACLSSYSLAQLTGKDGSPWPVVTASCP